MPVTEGGIGHATLELELPDNLVKRNPVIKSIFAGRKYKNA